MNILHNKRELAERNEKLNERDRQRDQQIKNAIMAREIRSLKQKEIDNFRVLDNNENLGSLKNTRFQENC